MRILALIPARGGSTRVPGKNVRPLGGNPLINWTIEVAQEISSICDILVSTDDPNIARTSREAGAMVPWLRPAEISTNLSPVVLACLHALDWYEEENGNIDGVMLLQPTSPFRSRKNIRRGIDLFARNNCCSVVSVSPSRSHPMWCYQVQDQMMRPFIEGNGAPIRSQDLPPAYELNGAFYLAAPESLRSKMTFVDESTIPLVIEEPEENIDIDTEWDWSMAEAFLLTKRVSK